MPLAFIAGILALETFARFGLGLGSPPLVVAHPTIEYLCQPNGAYRRFGRDVRYNAYGMRSDPITQRRQANEMRVLVLGDSVPNGGSLTDQTELATSLLQTRLTASLAPRPVLVANISAGSWSPPNLLAYLQAFGTFDADAAVLVLNKEDWYDFPTFQPLNPATHPTHRPLTASGELIHRYLWPRLRAALNRPSPQTAPAPVRARSCAPELLAAIDLLQQRHCAVSVLYHPSQSEFTPEGQFRPDTVFTEIADTLAEVGLELHTMEDRYSKAWRDGHSPFRDAMHPNPLGQRLLAEAMIEILDRPASPPMVRLGDVR